VAHLYDLMLLLDPTAPEGRGEAIVAEIRTMIDSSGTLVGEHDWGQRKMSFEIRHRPEAQYTLFQFEGENELLERLNHTLKITDGVLRHRIIRVKPGTPPPPEPRPDAAPRRDREPRGAERVAARAAADADAE
jgi:small subunit ribosomal protein S6